MREVLAALDKEYADKSASSYMFKMTNFINCRLEEGGDIEKHITTFESLLDEQIRVGKLAR